MLQNPLSKLAAWSKMHKDVLAAIHFESDFGQHFISFPNFFMREYASLSKYLSKNVQVVMQVVNNEKVMAKTPREANLYGNWCVRKGLRQDPLDEAILVIFGRRALIFFVWKLLDKNEKCNHFCAHAQWWSPWRRKNVEKGHLAPSNLTFLLIAIDTNGFHRMKEEGLIYKTLPQIFFNFCLGT